MNTRSRKTAELEEYEHFEVSVGTHEKAGSRPIKRKQDASGGRIFKTRRITDGKIFRVGEFKVKVKNAKRQTHDTMEELLRLFHHRNVVRLVDVVYTTNKPSAVEGYLLWDDCNRGTLNRLLWHDPSGEPTEIPESLCWHVLHGISKALSWIALPQYSPGEDCNSIAMVAINPRKIYFTNTEDNETYGDVKLGGYRSAWVPAYKEYSRRLNRTEKTFELSPYVAPEALKENRQGSLKSAIWSLGAVIYHMIVGEPPTQVDMSAETTINTNDDFWVKQPPERFTAPLWDIVRFMLRIEDEQRPDVDELRDLVEYEMNAWRRDTAEGKRYIMKGEGRGESKSINPS